MTFGSIGIRESRSIYSRTFCFHRSRKKEAVRNALIYLAKRFEIDCWVTVKHEQTDGDRLLGLRLNYYLSGKRLGLQETSTKFTITCSSNHKNVIQLRVKIISDILLINVIENKLYKNVLYLRKDVIREKYIIHIIENFPNSSVQFFIHNFPFSIKSRKLRECFVSSIIFLIFVQCCWKPNIC